MKKVSAPVRIDISGGWSDADPYRKDFGGIVLNAALNLRVSLTLDETRLISSLGNVPRNSGLGTSGSLRSAYVLISNDKLKNKLDLIRRVWILENKAIDQRAGFQDQAAAIFGGVNLWKFNKGDGEKAVIQRFPIDKKKADKLEKKIVLVNTGKPHLSSGIHDLVFGKNYRKNIPLLRKIKELALEMSKKIDKEEIAELINETWDLEKKLHPLIETKLMKVLQDKLRSCYLGARSTGAGGGGCMIFYTSDKNNFIKKFNKIKTTAKIIPFKFDYDGIRVED